MVGYNQLAKVVCIACSEPLGEHSKKNLVRCLFRVQGTMVSNGIENEPSSLSEGDIADARNEGHINIKEFDRAVG
jgi:hypothetical protein